MVDQVRAHVAQGADAEVEPAAPVERVIDRVPGNVLRDRAEVEVPAEPFRGRVVAPQPEGGRVGDGPPVPRGRRARAGLGRRHRPGDALGPDRPVGPDVDLAHVAQGAGLHDFHRPAELIAGRALVAHLGGDLVLLGRLPHQAGFVNVVRQRFLGVAMLAQAHRQDAGVGVRVVGRRHHDGVDVLLPLQHRAEIVPDGDLGQEAVAVGGAFWAWLFQRTGSLVAVWWSHVLIDAALMAIGYDLLFNQR